MNSYRYGIGAIATVALAAMLLAGCGSEDVSPPTALEGGAAVSETPAPPAEDHGHHDHHHTAPHGGALVVLPDDIGHLEAVLDAATGTLTLYCLDSHAEEAVRISAETISITVTTAADTAVPLVLEARVSALTGETAGDTSVFEGASPALKGAARFTGVIETLHFKGADLSGIQIAYPDGSE